MTALAALLTLAALPAAAQKMDHSRMGHATPQADERLGTVSFPVSCASASQAPFNRGVALLHNFWYEEARRQFDQLVKSDPGCAMAHWGVAMSIFHQIWDRPSPKDNKLGWAGMRRAQSLKAGSARERDYIAALAAFYRPGSTKFPARIEAYSKAMGELQAKYPDDVDAGVFHALSLLAAQKPDDLSLTAQRKAMAVLTPLFAKHPDNPGVLHYITHACDNPAMARDALTAAGRYGAVAWSGPHAFHMPGHIYSRLGLWAMEIASQLGSIASSEKAETHGASGVMDEPHSYEFLLYAYLQSGLDGLAKSVLARSAAPLAAIESMHGMGPGTVQYFKTKLPVFYALEMRDWKAAAALEPVAKSAPEVSVLVYWARAMAAGRLRDRETARAALAKYDDLMARLKKGSRAYVTEGAAPKIERFEMRAWVAFAEGNADEALKNMRSAADLQDQVGQGEVDIPAREMLADILLELGRPREALVEYEAANKLSPNRLNGLYSAGRAAEAAGDKRMAVSFYQALLKSTHNGEKSARPELAHARSFVSAAGAS